MYYFSPSDLETSDKIKRKDEVLDGNLCLWMSDSFPGLPSSAWCVQSSTTAGVSDTEMGLTDPGAANDAY